MSWTAPKTWAVGDVLTAADMNTYVRDNETALQPQGAQVSTSQTTTSGTYTDLTTVGPAVTASTGATVLLTLSAQIITNTSNGGGWMSFAVSGATTLSASDNTALLLSSPNANNNFTGSIVLLISGLTAGTNTFTAKYRTQTGGNTSTFLNRVLIIEACYP